MQLTAGEAEPLPSVCEVLGGTLITKKLNDGPEKWPSGDLHIQSPGPTSPGGRREQIFTVVLRPPLSRHGSHMHAHMSKCKN